MHPSLWSVMVLGSRQLQSHAFGKLLDQFSWYKPVLHKLSGLFSWQRLASTNYWTYSAGENLAFTNYQTYWVRENLASANFQAYLVAETWLPQTIKTYSLDENLLQHQLLWRRLGDVIDPRLRWMLMVAHTCWVHLWSMERMIYMFVLIFNNNELVKSK